MKYLLAISGIIIFSLLVGCYESKITKYEMVKIDSEDLYIMFSPKLKGRYENVLDDSIIYLIQNINSRSFFLNKIVNKHTIWERKYEILKAPNDSMSVNEKEKDGTHKIVIVKGKYFISKQLQ